MYSIYVAMYGIYTHTRLCMYAILYLPHVTCTCIVVFAVSNPMLLSALHTKTSPLRGSVIVIVEIFSPDR